MVARAEVLAASIKLLRERGATGVTVRSVADALGVSRQVVYTQFGSFAGLIDELYRIGFERLRCAGPVLDDSVVGVDRVVAHAFAYRTFALANPELYQVMFERPFRTYSPLRSSQTVALAAFNPLVQVVAASARRSVEEARHVAFTLWAAMHGVVHLELQGYFTFEASTEARLETIVRGVLDRAE